MWFLWQLVPASCQAANTQHLHRYSNPQWLKLCCVAHFNSAYTVFFSVLVLLVKTTQLVEWLGEYIRLFFGKILSSYLLTGSREEIISTFSTNGASQTNSAVLHTAQLKENPVAWCQIWPYPFDFNYIGFDKHCLWMSPSVKPDPLQAMLFFFAN